MRSMHGGMLVGLLVVTAWAPAQTAPLPQFSNVLEMDSGPLLNPGSERAVIFSQDIRVPDATWLRLEFAEATLGGFCGSAAGLVESGAQPTILRLTSLGDGAMQHHTAVTLSQWRNTTAYFNGDTVRLEVIADPGVTTSHLVLASAMAGVMPAAGEQTICGETDDRTLSTDPRSARAVPIGCTAWLIDDSRNCFLTAGHCTGVGLQTVEFNIPLSESGGTIVHPGPEDQYAVDVASLQAINGGVGNDWAYFGCFPNTETALTPGEAQGAFFTLASAPPAVGGQLIRVTGYGTDTTPQEWNQTQQTHAGPYFSFKGTTVQYETDTTAGNSGSPVIDETTGMAIGIHTHGGCTAIGDVNNGTAINLAALQAALATPGGVCVPAPTLLFDYPDGLPAMVDPYDATLRVEVSGANGGVPQPGSGMLHLDTGGGFIATPMDEVTPNVYDALFPMMDCATVVQFYVSAQTTGGATVTNPLLAPTQTFSSLVATGENTVFGDDFQVDLGWTVVDQGGLTTGTWERGVPIGGGDRGDPPSDADGSGMCALTENLDGNSDVDDGTTILTSPAMDASNGSTVIGYSRWYSNNTGDAPLQDVMLVEVSDNNGSNWTLLEQVGPSGPQVNGGWFDVSFTVADFVKPTDQFRIRFIVSDLGEGSIVEAGVDAVLLSGVFCDPACPGDCEPVPDGAIGITDLLALLAQWGGAGNCDLDGAGVSITDLLALLAAWGPCL